LPFHTILEVDTNRHTQRHTHVHTQI